MSGLKFCMITTFYPPYNFGGDGIGVKRLSEALVRLGHSVTVLHDVDAYRVLSRGKTPQERSESCGVDVVPLKSRLGILSLLLTHQLGRPVVHRGEIRQILDSGNFDVINFHNISLAGGPGLFCLGDALKLYMAHEHWLVCPTHVLWRHQREPCTRRQCLRCVLNYHRPPQIWRYSGYLKRQLKQIDAFIAMSEFSRRKHQEFGFPAQMEVVSYFLPELVNKSESVSDESPHPRPYFLFVGRLEKIKGLDEVIEAFRTYTAADLLVAGDGDDEDRLRTLASDESHVVFLGRTGSDLLDRLYRHAQALIVPSAGFETFGIILIEAFRHGTPVIARKIGPFPEIVNRCGGGLLFDDQSQLESAMHLLQNEPTLRNRLSQQARKGFQENWSETAVLPRYLEVVYRAAKASGRKDIVSKLERGHDS